MTMSCWRDGCRRAGPLSLEPPTRGLCQVCRHKGYYVGRAGQYRLPAKSGLPDRFWLHVVVAANSAALGVLGLVLLPSPAAWMVLAAHIVAVCLFLVYEVMETGDINDQAYRDIAGYQVGYLATWWVAGAVLAIVHWL